MKAYSIKKIINKKVTFPPVNDSIPLKTRHLPIFPNHTMPEALFLPCI
jgi:hypothetical protein